MKADDWQVDISNYARQPQEAHNARFSYQENKIQIQNNKTRTKWWQMAKSNFYYKFFTDKIIFQNYALKSSIKLNNLH